MKRLIIAIILLFITSNIHEILFSFAVFFCIIIFIDGFLADDLIDLDENDIDKDEHKGLGHTPGVVTGRIRRGIKRARRMRR